MSASQAQPAPKRNLVGLIIVAVALVLLAIGYVTVLRGYKSEGDNRSFHISDKPSDNDYIKVDLKVIGVDPIKGDMIVRMAFNPEGDMQKDEFSPAHDITLFINCATGKQEHKFEKGKRMNPMDVTIPLAGQASDYPFDSHEAVLEMIMTTPVKAEEKPQQPKETGDEEHAAAAPKPQEKGSFYDTNEPVPMAVEFEGSIPGLKLDAEKDKDSDVGYTGIEMKVSRSSTVIFFSTFVMVLMLCLTAVAIIMLLRFWLGGRKIELGAMSLYGAMLFAFPAMRNSQPGVPPLGTYSDYISFFWAESLIAILLVTIISLWAFRKA